jgi:16S rRNA (uracil1498-N3)-methyltransferase
LVNPLFLTEINGDYQPGDTFTLMGDEAHHAIAVRRMRVGEKIQISNGLGRRLTGTVSSVGKRELEIEVSSTVTENPAAMSLTLVQAIAKGDRDELAVQAATEIGVSSIIPWAADRSVAKWDEQKRERNQQRWQQIVDEAVKQSLQAWRPSVETMVNSKQLVDSFAEFSKVLVLDPTSAVPLAASIPANLQGEKIALVVGPEGGINNAELVLFESAGAARVRLGSSVLRTSTASISAVAVLQARAQLWG